MASANHTAPVADDLSSLEAGLDALETGHHIKRGGSRLRAVIAPLAGTVFLVARSEVSALGEMQESVKRLNQAGVAVKGAIFNGLDLAKRRYGYGYGYGYKYKRYGYRYQAYQYGQTEKR